MNLLHKIAQEAKLGSLKSTKENSKKQKATPKQIKKFREQGQETIKHEDHYQFKKHYHFQNNGITQSVAPEKIKRHNRNRQNWGGFTY